MNNLRVIIRTVDIDEEEVCQIKVSQNAPEDVELTKNCGSIVKSWNFSFNLLSVDTNLQIKTYYIRTSW